MVRAWFTLIPTLALALAAGLLACSSRHSAATPFTVCVVRHAEAFSNLESPPAGMTPDQLDALTANGRTQAASIARELVAPVAHVWASPRNRTRQTAELLGVDAPVQVVDDLRPLDGKIAWSERLAQWASGRDPRPAGGESLADAHNRVSAMLGRVRTTLRPSETAVLVTHSDISAILIGELAGTPLLERPGKHKLQVAQVACFANPLASP